MIDLHYQFELYLQRVGASKETLPAVQYIEMKRAFMGACGQMLQLMRDDIAALPEKEGLEQLQDLWEQVKLYWINETRAMK